MQISKTEAKDLMAKITLVVEPADYAEQVEKEIRTIRQKANVPGFRPGKVPASLVKKMYGKSVLAETINKVIGEKLYDYIREEKLNILGEPLSNEEETPELDFDSQDTFTFVFDIALAPEFNCKLTASNKIPYYDVQVTDEMVQKQVEAYANRYGKMEQQPEEEKAEGEEAEKKEKKAPKIIPAEINQELFDKVFGEGTVKGEKEFREKVKADMKAQMDDDAKYRFGIDVKAAVMKKMEKVSFPEEFLKRFLKLRREQDNKENTEVTDEEAQSMFKQLRWQLVKDHIAQELGVKVEKEDIDTAAFIFAQQQLSQYGIYNAPEDLVKQQAERYMQDERAFEMIQEHAIDNKFFAAVREAVKVNEKTISVEDFRKLYEKDEK